MRSASVIIIAYLFGSIPFGYLIVRATQGADVRETGSGGTGATNVSRRAGKLAGSVTLLLDALKGAAAVAIARALLGLPVLPALGDGHVGPPLQFLDVQIQNDLYWWVGAAAVAAIVGHIFPMWLRFRGGKGVATGVGVFLMLSPIAVGLSAVIFAIVVWRTRYVSLGSILAAAAIPSFVVLQHFVIAPVAALPAMLSAAVVGASLIVWAHRENIRRLMSGAETKFT
ncbi:MAG TPA: glycerol-3-phosphate 1-O-acyltransferase PlsY [Pyrinomonadaceae bacterium]